MISRNLSSETYDARSIEPAATPDTTMQDTESVNSAFLGLYREMEAGNTLVDRMINLYLAEAPAAIQSIRTTINDDDPEALSKAAHKFKSSNVQLGADRMASLCTQLEKLGQLGTTSGGRQILLDMDEELTYVRAALQRYRRQEPDSGLEATDIQVSI